LNVYAEHIQPHKHLSLGYKQRARGLVVKTTGCVMYYCGSSPTEVILWFENGWILIIQSREKG
jgi:hypothetical protein